MNRREKIIVSLMVVAAVAGAIDYLLTSSSAPETAGRGPAHGDIPTAISNASIELATLQLSPVRREILENIDVPWRPDLLIEREPTNENQPSASNKPAIPIFTAYFKINGKPLAIINGHDYAEGDWLKGGAYQIELIAPTQAKLKPQAGGETMLIPIEPGFTKRSTQPK